MAIKFNPNVMEELGRLVAPPPPPPPKRKRHADDGWRPALSPKQQEAFDSTARFLLCHGEKGTGKSIGLLHKLVRHCYENENALALILVRVKSMATKGGAWDKLQHHVLPRWKYGNLDRENKRIDDGLGIEYTDVKFDSQHNEFIWVENAHGGWSMVVLVSAPHAKQLRDRIRGYEPSIVFVDELTSCDSVEYLRAVAAQVGRRENISGPQQYMAACNPEGPSHWVYKVWWEEAYNPKTDQWDSDYHKIHVPMSDNRENLPPGYVEGLEKLYKSDPVEAARMLKGEWVDRPSGQALFLNVFFEAVHVRPTPPTMERLLPVREFPICIGMDPGAVNNAFILMQYLPVENDMKWLVFDEMVTIDRRIRYGLLVRSLFKRLKFWNEQMEHQFSFSYVADNSAFNQYRAASGSYDVLDFEREANDGEHPLHKQLGLPRMKVVAAPKFAGSVKARTRMVMDLLGAEQIVVSAGCPRVIEMFKFLESEAQPDNNSYDADLALTPRRSRHLHVYDAMCNPILAGRLQPQLLAPRPQTSQEVVEIGRRS